MRHTNILSQSQILSSMAETTPNEKEYENAEPSKSKKPARSVAFLSSNNTDACENEDSDVSSNKSNSYQSHLAKLIAQGQPKGYQQSIITEGDSSTSSLQQQSSQALTHLQFHWPGQTGGGRQHLDVKPMLYHDLLSSNYRIVIPLFQRRYCWSEVQIRQWYNDVATTVAEQHRTNKTMFKKQKHQGEGIDGDDVLLCIDGQQRMTTTTLFLAALRVQCRKNDLLVLVDKIDSILFKGRHSKQNVRDWAEDQATLLLSVTSQQQESTSLDNTDAKYTMTPLPTGWLPTTFQSTLVPSYVDRAAYFESICKDYVEEALEKQQQERHRGQLNTNATSSRNNNLTCLAFSSQCKESIQHSAFQIFSQELSKAVAGLAMTSDSDSPNSKNNRRISSFLFRLFEKQLRGFTCMYVELLNNDNLQQIFLWMQEKSVFGMGRLLYNPHPGVDFTPIDLARNLVVSSVMNEPLEEQVSFYRSCWLIPLEERFGTDQLGKILTQFVERIVKDDGGRYIGDMEKQLEQYKTMAPLALRQNFDNDTPMMVYGRFHSYVQQRAIEIEGEPCAITRVVADSIVQELVQEGEGMCL